MIYLSSIFSSFDIIFNIMFILFLLIFVSCVIMIVSPKMRAKWMGRQVKATKYMLEETKDDFTDIATMSSSIAINSKKKVLDNNEDVLRDMASKEASINKEKVKVMTRAVKEGLSGDKIYCKHCGKEIDVDSQFCKFCGKAV